MYQDHQKSLTSFEYEEVSEKIFKFVFQATQFFTHKNTTQGILLHEKGTEKEGESH